AGRVPRGRSGPEEAREHPPADRRWAAQEVVHAGLSLRPAVPRRGAERARADHGEDRHDRREHPGPPLHPLCARGGAVNGPAVSAATEETPLRYTRSTTPEAKPLRYKLILLKLSGEALLGDRQYGVDPAVCAFIARQVAEIHGAGVQIGIVVGGGNIFRGMAASARGMDRATGDYIGMLATVMNGLALQDALERAGVPTRVMTAIAMNEIAEPYIRRRAIRHLEKGRVAVFVAGTGNPYF